MLMLFLEQARGRPTWSLRLPSAHGHHVGDPWVTRYAKLAKYVKLSVYKHDRAQSDTTHSGSVYSASWGKTCAETILPLFEHSWLQ